jgi:hypothetical protein
MRAHRIENAVVVNTIEVESLDFLPNLVDGENGGSIGDRYENGQFIKPPEPPAPDYKTLRAAEYPPIGDQLDALWKGGEAAAAMLAQVQAVKVKYPKPE